MKTILLPQNKDKLFGFLQARFASLRLLTSVSKIMYVCITMHTIIIGDERDLYSFRYDFNGYDQGSYPIRH